MTAEETLAAAKAAYETDRPLTLAEFQAMRDAQQDPTTDIIIRGALKELGTVIERQSTIRMRQQEQDRYVEEGRKHARKLEEREQRWRALPELTARLFSAVAEAPHEPVLRLLLKHLQKADRGSAPRTFEPAILPEYDRIAGFSS